MAKAADFDGKANETEVITPESVKGKRKTSILGKKARLWLITINNPQNHGISLEQAEILERFKEDIASGAVTYVSSVMERSLTTDENGKHSLFDETKRNSTLSSIIERYNKIVLEAETDPSLRIEFEAR